MRIAVVCADERMQQVSDNLSRHFHVLEIHNANDVEICKHDIDILVLPVKGTDIDGNIGEISPLPSFWEELDEHIIIYCGIYNRFLETLGNQKVYYMEDECVIRDNAILTAEGVLNELIGCCGRSIYDVRIDVIGYGHCGKVIYEMLHNLQTDVRVIRRQCEENEAFITIDHWSDVGDIIINTSIQQVVDKKRLRSWDKRPVIIDIATPDVIDVACAKEMGINVVKAGNLPGRIASISAGNIIAEFIRGKLT